MEGNLPHLGPTNQLTGSPEPSPETPRPEEDMNAEHTGLHDPPFSFTAWWPPTRGAGGLIIPPTPGLICPVVGYTV